jgi:hypothetical protein
MFKITKLEIHENNLHFVFCSKAESDQFEVSFGLRDNERWVLLERNRELLVKPDKKINNYEVNVNLNEILNHFQSISGKRNVLDIHVKHQSEYHKLIIPNETVEYIRSKQVVSITPLLNLKYYVINNETLGIQLLAKNIKPILNDLIFEGGTVKFKINTILNKETINFNANKLFVMQRTILDTPQTYSKWQSIDWDESDTFILSSFVFSEFILDEKEIFDLMVEYKSGNYTLQVPLNAGQISISVKKWCQFNVLYDLAILKGKTGNLSIRITQRKLSIDLEGLTIEEGLLTLKLKNDVINRTSLKFQIRSYLEGMHIKDSTIFYEQDISYIPTDENLIVSTNLYNLFGKFSSNYKRKFKLFIEIDDHLYKINMADTHEPVCINKAVINLYFDDTLILETSLLATNPIPIAIMGSCYSRNAFNSEQYFNPDYKNYFKTSFSFFWPSIISLVSQPLPYDPNMFLDVKEDNYLEIEWELLKNWDKALLDSGAEYLLLDFFVDAMHGVLQFGPNQFLTRNLFLRKANYYTSTLVKEGKSIDCYHPEYFPLWTKSFDKFVDKLKGIIPEENIILNLSLLTDKFHDEHGGITSFIDSKHITKSHYLHVNHTWTKMNNYFLTKLPRAKVIDMNNLSFIGQFNAPTELAILGPHHFESGYYKTIISELCKVIVLDKRTSNLEKLGALK